LEKHYMVRLDKLGQDSLSGLRKGATRLSVLIKDMLELTKMHRIKNPYSKVSIQDIVDVSLANCDFMIRQANAEIRVDGKLPEIICDRIKMTAVFTNLINNAVKFSKPNEPVIIHIGWNETPKEYEFYVKDNGVGIDPQFHQVIFEIFKRAHASEQYAGTGVGLAIVKAALEDHGGRIRVESSPDQGTTFIFNIPKNLIPAKPIY